MAVRSVVVAVLAVSGAQWIEYRELRPRWWAEAHALFDGHVPSNLIKWVEGPREETVFDEGQRLVRLVVEGVAEVPDCPGFAVEAVS